MNETRFKELLNLHLDHRLSADEAVELDKAMQEQPALRRRLRAYEIMNVGCAELFRRSEADAPAPDALVRALRQAEARMCARRERRVLLQGWLTWGAAAGAAAVVALMVARVTQPGTGSPAAVAAVDTANSGNVDVAAVPAGASVARRGDAAVASAERRSALPEHLTLVALGIAPETAQPSSSLAEWSLAASSEGSGRAVAIAEPPAAWMAATRAPAGTEWNTPRAVSAAVFSSRPIGGSWQGTSGFQVQTTGYTFER